MVEDLTRRGAPVYPLARNPLLAPHAAARKKDSLECFIARSRVIHRGKSADFFSTFDGSRSSLAGPLGRETFSNFRPANIDISRRLH